MTIAFISMPGGWEIWIILVIVLLLFGHRIPSMARALGSGIVEFKKGLKGGGEDDAPRSSSPPRELPRSDEGTHSSVPRKERHEANT